MPVSKTKAICGIPQCTNTLQLYFSKLR